MKTATVVAVAAVVFAAAGCGGSAKQSSAPSGGQAGWLAFSRCMRSHGVHAYPYPNSSGRPPKRSLVQLGVSSSRFVAAQASCRRLLPNGGRPPSQAARQQVRARSLRFSECVRAHGVPGFPDPDSTGRIPDPASAGIDQGSPSFEAANRACATDRPPYIPSNADYNAWARTHGGS